MRMFSTAEPFMEVEAEKHIPSTVELEEMRHDIARASGERFPIPVFSEMHLYPRLGKEDARFVLAVVDEYSRLIEKLGTAKVRELLEGTN